MAFIHALCEALQNYSRSRPHGITQREERSPKRRKKKCVYNEHKEFAVLVLSVNKAGYRWYVLKRKARLAQNLSSVLFPTLHPWVVCWIWFKKIQVDDLKIQTVVSPQVRYILGNMKSSLSGGTPLSLAEFLHPGVWEWHVEEFIRDSGLWHWFSVHIPRLCKRSSKGNIGIMKIFAQFSSNISGTTARIGQDKLIFRRLRY